jgi:hypothetical protein
MTYCIFGPFGWEVVEPLTFLVTAFYLAFGTGYYITFRNDFLYTNAYKYFFDRRLRKTLNPADKEK